ncbi:hypothetical protein F4776DRAFT_640698 [Hypoxylon sp. NC0597]|nr:hypothetical protein F4776DRAFT_640698 [Hypoxylon sp. NC0597]
MCHQHLQWYHCYECQREFHHRMIFKLCIEAEKGRPCPRLTNGQSVVLNHEVCDTCKEARQAEEIVQQNIYRQRPLYYNTDKKVFTRETYW